MFLSICEKTFQSKVLESQVPVLVNFWAPWCGVCRLVHPLLDQLQASSQARLMIVHVNADENLRLSNTYRLKTLPTLLLFAGGHVRDRIEGFQSRNGLQVALERVRLMSLELGAESVELNRR
ncbi:MAG: thioredoxin family protein [Cyanobacteria bacterium P01_H01_bin.121]